ncbi:hypothetical protein Hte_006227 [Hypoxylon texense]
MLLLQSPTPGPTTTTNEALHVELKYVQDELENLYDKLQDAQRHRTSLMVKTLFWPFRDDETIRWANSLGHCKDRIEATTLMSGLRLQLATLDEIRELRNKTETAKQEQQKQLILDWICDDGWRRRHAELTLAHHPNTGQWIFETNELHDWVNKDIKTLWLYGAPGVGKTQLMALIIDRLSATEKIAYFYCDYHTSSSKSVTTEIAAAILRQLLENEVTMPTAVRDLYKALGASRRKLKLDDITTLIHRICLAQPKLFIILDALDECGSQRKPVLQLLERLSARVLISSRPHICELGKVFGSYSQLEISARPSDIKSFTEHMITTSDELSELIPEDMKEDIVKRIADQSAGMFLISALQCTHLTHLSRLSEIKQAVKALPTGLDDLYKESMERIGLEPLGKRSIALKALSWIYHSKRQLSTGELVHALAMNPDEPIPMYEDVVKRKVVLDVCAGLVVVDAENDTFRFVHHSLHEYFENTSYLWFPSARLDITRACLAYLQLISPGRSPTDSVLLRPFLRYAAQHWGSHAREEYCEDLNSIALDTLQNNSTVEMIAVILDNEHPEGKFVPMPPCPNLAVQLSSRFGALPILKLLIAHGHSLVGGDSNHRTALHWAARGGFVDVVHTILQSGADASPKTEDGMTPLHWAAKHGHARVVEELLSRTNPAEAALDGRTALHWASSRGHISVVKLLLSDKRVDVGCHSQNGWTALHWAACSGNRAVVVHGVEKSVQDGGSSSESPPEAFSSISGGETKGHEEVVRLLLDSGASPSAQNKQHQTALHWAAASGNAKIVRLLLDRGADLNTRDVHGFTPWQMAVDNGVDDVVTKMLALSNNGGAA